LLASPAAGLNGSQNGFTSTASNFSIAYPAGTTVAAAVAVTKPRKKRLLFVDATLQVLTVAGAGETIRMYPRMNGSIGADPNSATPATDAVVKVCTSAAGGDYPTCSLTGTWWLDVDAYESGNPGALLDQPILVEMMLETPAGNVTSANISMRVQLLRK
jgi:hypothetical protein